MLTREQILQHTLPTESVPCPEFGDSATLTVRRMTAKEFLALNAKLKAEPDLAFAHWITATVVDASGNKMFTEADVVALADKDFVLVNRLAEAAIRVNGDGRAQAEKNSTTRSSDSSTA